MMDFHSNNRGVSSFQVAVYSCVFMVGMTTAALLPQSCVTYSWKQVISSTHYIDGGCRSNRSANIDFTVTSPVTSLKVDFHNKVDLRSAYILCNSTDNNNIQMVYNGRTTQTINLCPDLYPGYYYAQYMELHGDGVSSLDITMTFGSSMNMGSCIHGKNSEHDTSQGRASAQYPQGGVYPIRCSLRLWASDQPVPGTNIALTTKGAVCNYWRPVWGNGNEQYCRRLLDGYVDPWTAPFAFTSDSKDGLQGTWIKIIFPVKTMVTTIAWIQQDYPKIRNFEVHDDSSNFENIACSLPLSIDHYMEWEVYDIGPYNTEYITVIFESIDDSRMNIGLYEVEIYTKLQESTTMLYNTEVNTLMTKVGVAGEMNESSSSILMIVIISASVLGLLVIICVIAVCVRCNKSNPTVKETGVTNPGYSVSPSLYSGDMSQQNMYSDIEEKPAFYVNLHSTPHYKLPSVKDDSSFMVRYDNAAAIISEGDNTLVHPYENIDDGYESLQGDSKSNGECTYVYANMNGK